MRRILKVIVLPAVILAASLVPRLDAQGAPLVADVQRIIDGDTFVLRGEERRIRIWGLDAPERNKAGGPAATHALRSLIAGQRLRCAVKDIDRYGRIVAQCVLPDGRDIAAAMIRGRVATEYCRYSRGYYGTC